MRILHVADLHIGQSGQWDTLAENGWPRSLVEDQELLMGMVNYAIEHDIDAVLFAGDAFKSRNPSPTQIVVFGWALSALSDAGIPVVLLPGNHDTPGVDSYARTVDIYGGNTTDRLTICDLPGIYPIDTNAGPLNVVAFPWGTFDSENYDRYIAEAQRGGVPVVTLAHLSVLDCRTGTEQGMVLGKETVWPIEAVAHSGVDYVALGHIHRHQVWYPASGTTVAYAGSLQRLDFGDEGDTKGFYVVDLDRSQHAVEPEFVPVQAREFLTLDWKTEPVPDVTDKIVRVLANLTEEEAGAFSDELSRESLIAARHVSIQKTIQRDRKTRADSTITTMGPLEALEQYLSIKGYTAERIKELIEVGKGMME